MQVYISDNEHQTVFCAVSPAHKDYGRVHPVWVFHNDGSFAREFHQAYFRSPPDKLRKPRNEFTLSDLREIVHGNEVPH